jgi:hypothetical protein
MASLNNFIFNCIIFSCSEYSAVRKMMVTRSKQKHDCLSNYNIAFVVDEDIDVDVLEDDNEEKWFDSDDGE